MKISIGCDHAGFSHKDPIIRFLLDHGVEIKDHGTYTEDSVDYADFVHPVANEVENGSSALGIVICGSGNGVAMTANKHQGVRAALCWNEEIAILAKSHNNANVIAIPSRFVSKELAVQMVRLFLETEFEGGRHQRRVDKIPCA